MKRFVLALGAVVLVSNQSPAAIAPDIEWIAQLPGLTVVTSTNDSGANQTQLTVGDPKATWDALRTGLQQHGWREVTSGSGGAQLKTIQSLVDTHEGHSLRASLTTIYGVGTHLTLTYRLDGDLALPAPEQWPPGPPKGGQFPTGTTYTADATLRTYHVMFRGLVRLGGVVKVTGTQDYIGCNGAFTLLDISGSNNYIVVDGPVTTIQIEGSNNAVLYNGKVKAPPPTVQDQGSHNLVQPL